MRVATTAAMLVGSLLTSCGGDGPAGPGTGTPRIALSGSQLSFLGVAGGGNPTPLTARITNGGSGTLAAIGAGSISYGATGSGWLSATLDATVAPATLTLTPSLAGLAGGSYTATVAITAPGAENSPQTVSVSLLVLEQGGLTSLDAAGHSAAFLDSPAFATRLAVTPGAEYLIAVVNTAGSPSVTEDFTFASVPFAASAVAGAPAAAAARPPLLPIQGPALALGRAENADLATLRRLTRNHVGLLERNRALYARTRAAARPGPGPRGLRPLARAGPAAASPVSETIGTVNKMYVRNDVDGGCADVDSVGARTVAVGEHVIVLADTNLTGWPQSVRPDSAFYQTFADEFDQVTWPHTQTYVGDPLLLDGDLSGVGKVTVLITPILNTLGGGAIAYVNPCDFFPKVDTGPDQNYSNFTEIFYSLASSTSFPLSVWQKQLRATATHEVKHIVAIASRIQANSPDLDEVWLEEGLAQVSSEIWMRHFNQATWKSNADFLQTVACELSLGPSAPCNLDNTRPFTLVISHLPFLWDYLQTGAGTPTAGLGTTTASSYGAGWALARWAIDRYALNEALFLRDLIAEPQLVGLANLSAHTGEAVPALLAYWNIATAIAGPRAFTPADSRAAFPSFNLPNIFLVGQTGLSCSGTPCGFFTESGIPVYPVQPEVVAAGGFTRTVTGVPGTAAAYFRLVGPAAGGTQVLQLLSGSRGALAPASGLRVVILRVT